jgi:hypothetical protein
MSNVPIILKYRGSRIIVKINEDKTLTYLKRKYRNITYEDLLLSDMYSRPIEIINDYITLLGEPGHMAFFTYRTKTDSIIINSDTIGCYTSDGRYADKEQVYYVPADFYTKCRDNGDLKSILDKIKCDDDDVIGIVCKDKHRGNIHTPPVEMSDHDERYNLLVCMMVGYLLNKYPDDFDDIPYHFMDFIDDYKITMEPDSFHLPDYVRNVDIPKKIKLLNYKPLVDAIKSNHFVFYYFAAFYNLVVRSTINNNSYISEDDKESFGQLRKNKISLMYDKRKERYNNKKKED